jgi:selenocysteine lyase/cysteine desulfurase
MCDTLCVCLWIHSIIEDVPLSGWCSYISGLESATTWDEQKKKLLYDEPYKFLGGTPCNIKNVELTINMMYALKDIDTSVSMFHDYVQSLHKHLLTTLARGGTRVFTAQAIPENPGALKSNSLVFDVTVSGAKRPSYTADLCAFMKTKQISFDHREKRFLRVGMGIEHSIRDVDRLAAALLAFEALQTNDSSSQ